VRPDKRDSIDAGVLPTLDRDLIFATTGDCYTPSLAWTRLGESCLPDRAPDAAREAAGVGIVGLPERRRSTGRSKRDTVSGSGRAAAGSEDVLLLGVLGADDEF
jgi:hypothetical protein